MATAQGPAGLVLRDLIAHQGFAFVNGTAMRELLNPYGSLADWPVFVASWNRLELDAYMADGGRYRRRRHAVYRVDANGQVARSAHQPHFQTLDYNPIHGGIERWFAPIDAEIGGGPSLRAILTFCRDLFSTLGHSAAIRQPASEEPDADNVARASEDSLASDWRVEVHQFRIEARRNEPGRPTPEGLHRDGVDHVLVLLVNRFNIARGVTTIHALDGHALGHFTLTDAFDAAIVDDTRVAHGVTPVEPIDPSLPAYRDVLVITFKAES